MPALRLMMSLSFLAFSMRAPAIIPPDDQHNMSERLVFITNSCALDGLFAGKTLKHDDKPASCGNALWYSYENAGCFRVRKTGLYGCNSRGRHTASVDAAAICAAEGTPASSCCSVLRRSACAVRRRCSDGTAAESTAARTVVMTTSAPGRCSSKTATNQRHMSTC